MGKTFKFWWMCAKRAAHGNSASANDWQWVFANPLWQSIGSAVCAGLGAFVSRYWRSAPMMSPDTFLGVFLGGLFGFAFTWLIFFIMRFFAIPPRLYHEQKDRADKLEEELRRCSPLQIIFDASNPHNRFWERTSPRDETGKKLPGLVWEYRVKIQNTSSKTVRNVRIARESFGLIPEMPSDLVFHKDGKQNRDLQPLCDELVAVFWKFPPQEGDAWGETATAFHGPIKIVASGDDVLPAKCEFDYYPDQIPAIVQRDSS